MSPPCYTKTILNQSTHVLSWDCFLNVFTFQDTYLMLNRNVKTLSAFAWTLHFFLVCHRRHKRCKLFSFSAKWFGNFKKDVIDKRLVNLVKYHYLSLRLLRSSFKKFENKCKNNHEVQIKLSRVQTCATDLASFLLTRSRFWHRLSISFFACNLTRNSIVG